MKVSFIIALCNALISVKKNVGPEASLERLAFIHQGLLCDQTGALLPTSEPLPSQVQE